MAATAPASSVTFAVGKNSSLLTTLLPAGYFDPLLTRVIVMVTLGGMPHRVDGRHGDAPGPGAEQRPRAVDADDHRR